MQKSYFTTGELAKILGISRIAIFKKIKKGQIKAMKIGRLYAVAKSEIPSLTRESLTKNNKEMIDKAVVKTVAEYGETLRLLGQE